MADQLSIILSAKLSNTASDITDLNRQIEQLQGKLNKLNLGLNIDSNSVKALNNVETAAKNVEKAMQTAMNPSLSDKGFQSFTTSVQKTLENVKSQFKDFDTIKTTTLFSGEEKALQSFVVQLENALGKITKLKYQIDTSAPMIGNAYPVKLMSTTEVDNTDKVSQQEAANAQKAAQQYEQWWLSALKNRELAEQQTIEREQVAEQKAADNYEQWWLKALKNRDLAEQQSVQKQEELEQKLANNYEQWWLKALKQRELSEQATIDKQNQAEQKAAQDYENWWLKALSNVEQAERQRVASLGTVKTTVDPTVFTQSGTLQTDALKQYITEAYAAETTSKELENAQINLSSAFDRTGNEILKYSVQFKDAEGNMRQFQGTFDQATAAMYQNSQRFTQASHEVSGFRATLDEFVAQMKFYPMYMAPWAIMALPMAGLHSITSTIVDIDTQMTQLKRVMANGTDFNGMLQQTISISNELGSKLTDVLNIESEFARQGFNQQDVLNLAKVTSLLVNIGDVTPTQAMTTLTTAMKNFNISASDSITIADKLNNISNNYSADTATLSDSLTKAATTAKTYGVSLNDLLGMTTAISETTKESGDVIGNSLKTIFSRIDSKASIKALQSVGIAVQDTAGNMKSVTSVLGELAGKWDTLSNTQQQNIAVSEAGRFQLTRFLALMQDWGTVVNASNTALNSQNSAMNENQRYQASLQAQLNRLQTAWKTLSLAIGNEVVSNGLISVVGGLTSLTKAITPLTNSIGIIPTVLATASIALTAFKSHAADTVGQIGKLGFALKLFGVESEAAMTGFKAALASTGVGIAVLVGSMGIEALLNAMGKAQAARAQEQDQINTLTSNYQTNANQIKNYANQYEQLSKTITDSKGNIDKSNPSYQSYLDVQNKLARLMPSLVSYTDADGQAHLKTASQINTEIQSVQTLEQAKKDLNAIQIKDDISQYAKNLEQAVIDLKKAQDQYGYDKNPTGTTSSNNPSSFYQTISAPQSVSGKQQAQDYLELANAQYQLQVLQQQGVSFTQQQASAYLDASKAGKDLTNTDKNLVNAYIEQNKNQINTKGSADDLTNSIDRLSTKAADYGKVIASVQKAFGNGVNLNFLSGNSVAQIQAIGELISSYKSGSITLDEFTKHLESLKLPSSEVAKVLSLLSNANDQNTKATQSDTSAINAQMDAQKTLQGLLNGTSKIEDVLSQEIIGYTAKEIDQQTQLIELYNALSQVTNKNAQQMALYNQVKAQLIQMFPDELKGQNLSLVGMENEVNARKVMSQAAVDSASNRMSAEEQVTYNLAQNLQKQEQIIKAMIKNYESLMMSAVKVDPKNGAVAMDGVAMYWYNQMKSAESQLSTVSDSYISATAKLAKEMNYSVSFNTPQFPNYSSSSGSSSSRKGSSGRSGSSSSAASQAAARQAQQDLQALQQQYQNTASSIVQIYKDMYTQEQTVAMNAIQKQIDALDAQHTKVMNNLQAEDQAYQDSVNKKLALIDKQAAAQSYNETLKQQQQTVQNDQNKINVLQLDNSPEGKVALAAAQQQLATDQKTLNDTISQHNTDMRKQNLQDSLTAYQSDIKNQENAETTKYNNQKAALQKQQNDVKAYYDNLLNDQRKFNSITNQVLAGNFTSIKKDFSSFADFIKKNMADIGQSISNNLLDNISAADSSISKLHGKMPTSTSQMSSSSNGGTHTSSNSSSGSSSSSKNKYYTVKSGDTLSGIAEKEYGHGTSAYWEKIARANGISNPRELRIGQRLIIPFDTGGFTGSWGTDGRLALLHQKELVLNKDDTSNMLKMVNIVRDLIPKFNFPDLSNLAGKLGNTINMPITIQNLNGGKEGATEFFNIIGNHMKIMGVNN